MTFQGSLKELPLPDIIQLVSVSGKTGVFVLEHESQKGEIFLKNGEIVHAAVGEVRGEEGVYELAIWQEGDFVFQPGVNTDQHTIKKSNTNLLMEAARRIDEWQVLSKRIPSTRRIPTFTSQGSATSVSFTPREWSVICKIDERRSIEEMALVLGMSPFEVCKLLYGLITAGLVELQESSGHLRIGKLSGLDPAALQQTVEQIFAQARALLSGHADRLAEAETTARRAKTEIESGRGHAAIQDMISSLERVISTALGPNQSRLFIERVNQLLG